MTLQLKISPIWRLLTDSRRPTSQKKDRYEKNNAQIHHGQTVEIKDGKKILRQSRKMTNYVEI